MKMRTYLFLMIIVVLPLTAIAANGLPFNTARGNIYSAGCSNTVTENAANDIVAAGCNVVISGNAGNEVLAAGGSVSLLGKTGGDVRVAGGNVTIDTVVGGEALLAGGHILLQPRTVIRNGLFAAGGDINIEGTIYGHTRIMGGTVSINGTVNNDIEIKAQRLIIGNKAVINGNLRYSAPQEAAIAQGAAINGETVFTHMRVAPHREKLAHFIWIWWLIKLIAVATAALVIYFLLTKKTEEFTALALDRFARELLTGFIVLVTIPALVLILFITGVGALLGIIGAFLYVSFIMLSGVLGAVVFSGLLRRYAFKKAFAVTWSLILLGVFVYQVFGLIPVLGWIFKFVFFLSALGSLSHLIYLRLTDKSAPAVQ